MIQQKDLTSKDFLAEAVLPNQTLLVNGINLSNFIVTKMIKKKILIGYTVEAWHTLTHFFAQEFSKFLRI